jgi:hypothetical protein
MVEFSTSGDVRGWVRGIEPAERRREVAVTLAARAALRVIPLVALALEKPGTRQALPGNERVLYAVVLPLFGAAALAWTAARFPKRASELGRAARAAGRRAENAIGSIPSIPHTVSHAATAAAFAADTVHVDDVAGNCAQAIDSAQEASAHAGSFRRISANSVMTRNIRADCTFVETGASPILLATTRLLNPPAPTFVNSTWGPLKSALIADGDDWRVWTDWFEARLAGDGLLPPNEALEVARATIPDNIWKLGPAAVNAEIKRLIDLHTPKHPVDATFALGVETLASVGDGVPSVGATFEGAEAKASAGEFVSNPEPPPAGWMNTGEDPAVQQSARTRSEARTASEAAFITQPPFPPDQAPSAGTAPQFVGATAPAIDLPPIETIPTQERAATQFRADAEGRIDVIRIPPTQDELQRIHYDEMRHKAVAMVALGQMLGDLGNPIDRMLEALPEHMEDASIDKLWSRANTLRRRHDAHVGAIDNNLGPNPARLDALVAAHLGDFVDSFNVYVLGDPRALELDSARLGPQDREAVRKIAALAAPIAHAASEPQSPATPAAQEALSEQVEAAIDASDDINGDQAAELARKTAGNFVAELLRRAYAPIAKLGDGIKKEAGFAQHEVRAGFYRAVGAGGLAGVPVAYAYWPEISAFVVRNADALKEFARALFQNPKLVEIIDLIVQAAKHLA